MNITPGEKVISGINVLDDGDLVGFFCECPQWLTEEQATKIANDVVSRFAGASPMTPALKAHIAAAIKYRFSAAFNPPLRQRLTAAS